MYNRQKAALETKLRQWMPPGCTVQTAWKSWQPRILNVYMDGPLGYTPPMLPSYMDNVKLHPSATAWEQDEHGEIQRIHRVELVTPPVLKVAEVRQWVAQQNLDITVSKKGGNYVFLKNGQFVAQYRVKETIPAQLEEMKTELAKNRERQPRYDERVPMNNEETVWAGYTYLLDGKPTPAPQTTTVGEWLKCCPAGSVITKCDVFGRGLVGCRCRYAEDQE